MSCGENSFIFVGVVLTYWRRGRESRLRLRACVEAPITLRAVNYAGHLSHRVSRAAQNIKSAAKPGHFMARSPLYHLSMPWRRRIEKFRGHPLYGNKIKLKANRQSGSDDVLLRYGA